MQFSRFSSFLGLSIQEAKSEIVGLTCSCGAQSRDGITKGKQKVYELRAKVDLKLKERPAAMIYLPPLY
jgi:hypothetical protein